MNSLATNNLSLSQDLEINNFLSSLEQAIDNLVSIMYKNKATIQGDISPSRVNIFIFLFFFLL